MLNIIAFEHCFPKKDSLCQSSVSLSNAQIQVSKFYGRVAKRKPVFEKKNPHIQSLEIPKGMQEEVLWSGKKRFFGLQT